MDTQTISTNKAQQELTVQEAAPVQKTAGAETVTPEKASPASTAKQPKYDQYIPEQPKESYGHYKPVADDNGVIQIKFDAPAEDGAVQKSQTEQVGSPAEPSKQEAGKRAEVIQFSGQASSRVLETRKKRLEQQIKSCGDIEKIKTLKQKLAQVKRELSAAKG